MWTLNSSCEYIVGNSGWMEYDLYGFCFGFEFLESCARYKFLVRCYMNGIMGARTAVLLIVGFFRAYSGLHE